MKKINIAALIIVMAGMLFTSCKKDATSSSLLVKLRATNKSYAVLATANGATLKTLISDARPALVWDTCLMNVSKIDLEAEKKETGNSNDSLEINFEWTGPKLVNLFDVNSIVGAISLQPGVYDEISIKIEAFKKDAKTSPVFYLAGSYTNPSALKIPVKVVINEDFEFKVAAKEGTKLTAVIDYSSLINLNLALLFKDILQSDLEGATLSNGKIVISSTSNYALYKKIKVNLSESEDSEFEQD